MKRIKAVSVSFWLVVALWCGCALWSLGRQAWYVRGVRRALDAMDIEEIDEGIRRLRDGRAEILVSDTEIHARTPDHPPETQLPPGPHLPDLDTEFHAPRTEGPPTGGPLLPNWSDTDISDFFPGGTRYPDGVYKWHFPDDADLD